MNDTTGHEGLSLGYRIGYRIRHMMLTVFGPAQLGDDDPRTQLEHERDDKVAEAKRHDEHHAA